MEKNYKICMSVIWKEMCHKNIEVVKKKFTPDGNKSFMYELYPLFLYAILFIFKFRKYKTRVILSMEIRKFSKECEIV